MDTLASYDELPYDSLPLPETQPDFLAAVARLHGFEASDPRHARILELGCAQGGNLIPLAWRWPESECVGVELSRVQAEAGMAFIQRLGLPNVRVLHGDLAALPDDLGEFDFIIAHGVFSWVPPSVQQALLEACRRHLSPQGIAYVSFNVAAGWQALQPLRAALIERTSAELPAPARFQQALRVLDALESEWADAALLKEIAYLKTAAPSYLFHEYLAEFNVPMPFAEFAAQLDRHGLRYVGEAGPRRAVVALEDAWGLIPEGMAGRWLDAEAALDGALAIRFRRALIARDDAPCAQPPQADALNGLVFHANLQSDEEIDLGTASEQAFVNPAGNTFRIALPAMKAAAMVLSAAYPGAIGYAALLSAAREVLADHAAGTLADETEFREALFQLVTIQGVMPTVWAGSFVAEPGERPCANALARLQADSPGWVVSGARHVAIDLDPAGRALLAALDGSRSVDELAAHMQVTLAQAGLELPLERVTELTWQQLWLFARLGLLV
ncbi:MAG: class I SAM-dependent methyltransferase [Thiobacillus sp.]|nr:class I SAM-dependent methyltransferase [Thiobacillus sp.]